MFNSVKSSICCNLDVTQWGKDLVSWCMVVHVQILFTLPDSVTKISVAPKVPSVINGSVDSRSYMSVSITGESGDAVGDSCRYGW